MKPKPSSSQGAGLARALSKLGFCSRREAWQMIEAGRVRVNGSVQRDPERRTVLARDKITVDGQPVGASEKIYLMLNKPRGLVTTASDERGRETVFSCFAGTELPRIFPVGRLDQASEGLLLFTNDTGWADRITDPLTHLEKTYHVQINRVADEALLRELRAGVEDEGEHLAAKRVSLLRAGEKNCWLEFILDEGKNRHLRRLLGALGIEVMRLVRVAVGPLELGALGKGEHRHLNPEEIKGLQVGRPRREDSLAPAALRLKVGEAERASRLRCHLKAAAESAVRRGHPWVFAESLTTQNRPGRTGELAALFDRQDRFLAIGLYDADSPLRVRVLHAGKPVTIDAGWWEARLESALARRAGLLDAATDSGRLINGESDGWPGLVLDRYAGVLVLKLYTAAWLPRLEETMGLLRRRLLNESPAGASALVLRLSRNVQAAFATAGYRDGQVLVGQVPDGPVIFQESGLKFEADVLQGQKTGFFLDQRENRREVERLSAGAEVLNAFSFTGGFSLYAARGGARTVASLDISAHALAGAERNFALNRKQPAVAACRHEIIQANAFDWLKENPGRMFDLIVLDPPSLAKRESERAGAIRAYEKLAASALAHLRPRGLLVAASCSAHVSAEEFFAAVRQAARASRRSFTEMKTTRHAPDHAAGFPEAEYLKAIYLSFAS